MRFAGSKVRVTHHFLRELLHTTMSMGEITIAAN